jgi:hypothetical protein
MYRTILSFICLAALVAVCCAQDFDYASYKPGDLEQVLAKPKPATGFDVISPERFALKVTLESYAETCGLAATIKLSTSMLPSVYPKGFVDALNGSKCVKVKSPKGVTASIAIQDAVAEFLPKEVPLGTEITVYCVLVCMTAEGPGLVVSEFESK